MDRGASNVPETNEPSALDLEAAISVDNSLPKAEDDCEKPPDYESLELFDHPKTPRQSNTFVAEAPPAYHQLFGRKSSRRPHTRARRTQTHHDSERDHDESLATRLQGRYPRLSNLLTVLMLVCVFVCLVGLSIAMIIIGSVNIDVCSSFAVPVYLIVAGVLMFIEILFHATIWLIMKTRDGDNESIFRALRVCDCAAFILFVWLLIGSNWIFKLSVARSSPCDTPLLIDNIVSLNTTVVTDSAGRTQWVVVTETDDSTPTSSCHDCPTTVYQFTVIVILLQYLAALLIVIGCCSKLFKK